MKGPGKLAWLALPSILLVALGARAVMIDDDLPGGGDPPDLCVEPAVQGVVGTPFLNGLPVIQQQLEIVGDSVKVVVETTTRCHPVTPASPCRSSGRSTARAAP